MNTQTVSFRLNGGRLIRGLDGITEMPDGVRDHNPREEGIVAASRIVHDVYGDRDRKRKPLKRKKSSG